MHSPCKIRKQSTQRYTQNPTQASKVNTQQLRTIKPNLRTLREKLSPRNLGAQFRRALFLRSTTRRRRRRHQHPLRFLRGLTWISRKFISPTNPKTTCMHKRCQFFSPWHWGDTKASPSTGTEGDLSGDIATQPSTAFNDAVSGRSESISSGSADSLAVPDSLTGATEGTVVDEESSDTYVIREREWERIDQQRTHLELRLESDTQMRKRVIGMERWYLAPFGVVGGRGRRERALGRGGAAASGFDHGWGGVLFRGRRWEKRRLWLRMIEADHVNVVCEGLCAAAFYVIVGDIINQYKKITIICI